MAAGNLRTEVDRRLRAVQNDGEPMEPIPSREGFQNLKEAKAEPTVRVECMLPWKRVLDLTFVVGTAMIWLPVFIMGAIWVRMVSGGPVLFRQTRIGVGEVPFTMLKLRTMHANAQTSSHEKHLRDLIASDAKMTKLDALGDSRLIFGGRLLRTLSIDEIPQFFNVLGGTMSVVGPRPCTMAELERYLPSQKERFSVHPGLTGHWQVFGKNQTTFSEMINMDINYARNITLRRELLIIVLTPFAILKDFVLTLEALFQAKRTATKSLETHNRFTTFREFHLMPPFRWSTLDFGRISTSVAWTTSLLSAFHCPQLFLIGSKSTSR